MKIRILIIFFSLCISQSFSQKGDQTLVTINGEKVLVSDFKKVYEKNLSAIDNDESKDVAKNLDLFINYKLKVEQAYRLGLDTLKSYKREIQTYRNQLIAPYLQDRSLLEKLIQEAYYRTKTEVRASHILIRLPRNYQPKDTVDAYNKIMAARERILKGESFEKVAKEVSEDKSVSYNGGDLGYFSAFKMIYDFEDVAYKMKEQEISLPFKTRFGYHILKRTGTRSSRGEVLVSHILVSDTTSVGKKRVDEVYTKLEKGGDFKKLAKEYSNDTGSKNRGGVLQKFGSGRMVKPFEEASFSLEKEGTYTKPFKTRFGWHIVKLGKKFPVLSFEEMKKEITDKVNRSGRSRLSDKAVLNRLKSEYTIEDYDDTKDFLKLKNLRAKPKDSLQNPILKINNSILKQEDFVSYIMNRRHLPNDVLYENFKNQEILNYYKNNLSNTNPEFAATLKEYEDGLLLFELMQRKVWNKSKDSVALKNYFDLNKSNYKSADLSKIRGKVMSDYQNFIEDNWNNELRSKNEIKINKRALKKLIKYYRKES